MKQSVLSISRPTGALTFEIENADSDQSENDGNNEFHPKLLQFDKKHYWTTNLISSICKPPCPVTVQSKDLSELAQKYEANFSSSSQNSDDCYHHDSMAIVKDKRAGAKSSLQLSSEEVHNLVEVAQRIYLQSNIVYKPGQQHPQLQAPFRADQLGPLQMSPINIQSTMPTTPPNNGLVATMSKRIIKRRDQQSADALYKLQLDNRIFELHKEHCLTIEQISRRLKISQHYVRKICKSAPRLSFQNSRPSSKRVRFKQFNSIIQNAINFFIRNTPSLVSAKTIRQHLQATYQFRTSLTHLRRYMKEILGMSYQRVGIVTPNQNSFECKLQRQLAAKEFVALLSSKKIIINVDESILSATDHRKMGWNPIRLRTREVFSQRVPYLNIIAGLASNGAAYFTINRGRTNSLTFVLYLDKLIRYLDVKQPDWRKTHVIMLDNAPYHKSNAVKSFLRFHKVPVMFLGPYHFQMAPVERFFAYIKGKDLNPDRCRVSSSEYLVRFIQHCSALIRDLDYSWAQKAFTGALVSSINSLSMQNI